METGLLAQDGHGDVGARNHDVLDFFVADDLVERIDDFLDVKHMEVVGALPHESLMVFSAVLIGREAEVEADYWKLTGSSAASTCIR